MPEARDPAIKLFGRTIPVPEGQPPAEDGVPPGKPPMPEPAADEKDICEEISKIEVKDPDGTEEGEPNCSSCLDNDNEDNHQTPSQDDKEMADPTPAQDASCQEKILKKPDKLLPCPRCNSLDTKFCYYNNYNVNQPRHFCKNCQRYWTAGGTMRNVPVGAGRRKNKQSASNYRNIMMSSDELAPARVDAPDSTHHKALSSGSSATTTPFKANGTVLKFGPETPLCESMASVLSLQERKRSTEISSLVCGENKEEPCASSAAASNCVENGFTEHAVHKKQNSFQGYCNGVTPMHQLQCYPGPPWAYPWSPGWKGLAAAMEAGRSSELSCGPENVSPTPVPWSGQSIMAAPAFCAPTVPFTFMPATFWGCMPGWTNETWNVPWLGANGVLSPTSPISNSGFSGNGLPTLGKHSRDANSQDEEKMEKSLWVPKTLRIDDPDEAVKSSIWATLGIKLDEGVVFKAFRSKEENKGQTSDAAQVLHSNPAALSRSQSFQERT